MQIRRIDAAETRPLRWTVLRPEMAGPDAVVLDGDDDPAGAHFGAFMADELVGVGSVFPQPHPDRPAPGDWRLRGMAVADGRRSLGVGKAVLEACLAFAAVGGASRVWCNARTPAVAFYEREGFVTEGTEFLAAGDRPHFRMWTEVDGSGR